MLALMQILAAEEERSGIDLLFPDDAELIWGIVAFALVFLFLRRFMWPQMSKALDERGARIQGQIEEAESVRQDAERLRRRYEEQLADARTRSEEIVEEARSEADQIRSQRLAEAEEDANAIRARAREDAEAERARLVQELRGQVAMLSVELAGKIVQRELDARRHAELVDQYINELSGLN